ncbi:hypothetical protein CCYS_10140 [Corynebacterium cystitidis DSM 20524]|uniref:Uncharacterized protein n=2 Tax=Corynebacterium cystitidis TaxID=35757 RepID=A0A1H9WAI6_9CORY|nr:hypothetical protein CCYS_10140 [Corynebacterium cystitidis DSM 20524]SES30824.1 hypothetical protein SAMN05661109_02621 [Corynebacterium cystitidis DSM 20524]SNV68805.1 Uncharacterised protein [Corynebacterium cystitidis]
MPSQEAGKDIYEKVRRRVQNSLEPRRLQPLNNKLQAIPTPRATVPAHRDQSIKGFDFTWLIPTSEIVFTMFTGPSPTKDKDYLITLEEVANVELGSNPLSKRWVYSESLQRIYCYIPGTSADSGVDLPVLKLPKPTDALSIKVHFWNAQKSTLDETAVFKGITAEATSALDTAGTRSLIQIEKKVW